MRYSFITIEGNIGAGKTSLATMLAEKYNGKLILEQFADNPFLPKFYENPSQNAFPLELFFLAERYQQLKTEVELDLFKTFMVSDYVFVKSLIFAKVTLEKDEYRLYSRLFQIINPTLPKPELLVYLHTPVEKLSENIRKRGRSYEQNIQPEYLQKLHETYMDFLRQQQNQRILVLDISNLDFVNRKKDFESVLEILNREYKSGINYINQ